MQVLTCEAFAARANETFDMTVGESRMPLTLVEVKPLAMQVFPGMMRAPFSLMFKSVKSVVLPQQIYRLDNAAMGKLDIFLVPVARDREGILYQAIFN